MKPTTVLPAGPADPAPAQGTRLTIAAEALSQTSCDAVRLSFNPSQLPEVVRIKMLAAALITECENLRGRAARDAAVAITNAETACMWAVKAATIGR